MTDPALIARLEALFLKTSAGREISQNWIDLADLRALLARIRELEAERVVARKALARLGSMEAFAIAGTAGPELIARVDYARAALASAPAEGNI